MAKILVSDFFGVLISDDPSGLEYLYSVGNNLRDLYTIYRDRKYFNFLIDKAFTQLGQQLNDFLAEGNYLKVVSAMDTHDPADFIFNEFVSRLYETVREYKNQVSVFLTSGAGNDLSSLSKVTTISEKDGYFYAENETGISVNIIYSKTDVFEFVKKEHDLTVDKLYAIGNSRGDIPMLFKCIELGGESSLINNDLYKANQSRIITTDSIIKDTVGINFNIRVEEIVCEMYPEFFNMDRYKQSIILDEVEEKFFEEQYYNGWSYNEYNKLYTELSEGKIDLNDLMKKKQIFDIFRLYNWSPDDGKRLSIKKINDLTMYPTFKDYSNKVLVRQKKL